MQDQASLIQHKWGGFNQHIDNWLAHRAKLLSHYCQVANLPPYETPQFTLPTPEQLTIFCNNLVDYISEGHFEIYEEIMLNYEQKHQERMRLNDKVVPKINITTDVALSFNEKYANCSATDDMHELDEDLSNLGELMEQRFELEDLLLEQLYQTHQQ